MKKNNLFILIFFTVLLFSTLVFSRVEGVAVEPPQATTPTTTEQKHLLPQNTSSKSMFEKNAYDINQIGKDGAKFTIAKFLLAMLGVGLSAVAIFFGLKIYQKFVLNSMNKETKTDPNSLDSPKAFKEAINNFLDKTDK